MKSFSELTSASQVNNEDLVAISQSTGNGYASKKTTVGDVTKNVYASNGKLGAKNLNALPYYESGNFVESGITWVVNDDGTATANGTATSNSNLVCHSRRSSAEGRPTDLYVPNGKYIVSGCQSDGSSSTYYIVTSVTLNGSASNLGTDYGNGVLIEINGDDYSNTGAYLQIACVIRSGYTANNVTFKPMLRLASDTDDTFQPYAMTNLELTKAVESGGGGTGGHTIIDENGTSMTARAGLQFVGGANVLDDATNNRTIVDVASAGGIDGVFVDTDNVIKSITTFTSSMSYTATEDCFIPFYIVMSSSDGVIKIDNKKVAGFIATSTVGYSAAYYLKKGQTISVTGTHASYPSDYTVYGIKTGTTHSKFQPVIYSTEEREIGVWEDGKPLYEKTFDLGSDLLVSTSSWTTLGITLDADKIVETKTTSTSGSFQGNILVYNDNGTWKGQTPRNGNDSSYVRYLTIVYTKTTDVAGSGTWTPQGVPTHHYSTDEQVIGTWIDGSTLYERTFTFAQIQSGADSWFNTGVDISSLNIDMFGDTKLLASSSGGNIIYDGISSRTSNNTLQCMHFRNANANFIGAIVQYTKSS